MYPNLWGGGHIDSGLDPIRSDFISPNLQRGGHIDFGEYPVGIGVTLSYLANQCLDS